MPSDPLQEHPPDDAASPLWSVRDNNPERRGGPWRGLIRVIRTPAAWIFFIALLLSWWVGRTVPPTWTVEKVTINARHDEEDRLYYIYRGEKTFIPQPGPWEEAALRPENIRQLNREGKSLLLKSKPLKASQKPSTTT